MVPGGLLIIAVLNVLRAHAEEVIDFIPSSDLVSIAALALAALILFINQRKNTGQSSWGE